jgi:ornithine carbamoyltransferase
VVNALTDAFHPCQGLADLLTIQEYKGPVFGLKLAYVGDGNNMANTYLEACALTGMDIAVATPDGYAPDPDVVAEARERGGENGARIEIGDDPIAAVADADVVITDTWTSMGDEAEHDRRLAVFHDFQVNDELMEHAKPDAIFLHCLPAHRGEEVTDSVMDGEQSVIYDEAENRLHAQKALLSLLMDRN